jgi:hypothetical protein
VSQVPNTNTFAQAQVEITVNTDGLTTGLADAKKQVEDLAKQLTGAGTQAEASLENKAVPAVNQTEKAIDKAVDSAVSLDKATKEATAATTNLGTTAATAGATAATNFVAVAAALAAVSAAALEAGQQIGTLLEKQLNNGKDSDFFLSQKEELEGLRRKLKEFRDQANDKSLIANLDDVLSTGKPEGFMYSDRAAAVKGYNDTANEIARIEQKNREQKEAEEKQKEQEKAERKKKALEREIEQTRIGSLEGEDQIRARAEMRKKQAREQYGNDADGLIREIEKSAQSDINKFMTTQAVKKGIEDKNREEREKKEMESAKRLAEAMAEAAAKAMSSALAGVSAEFQNVFNSQLGQMSFTIEGLAANVEKIANQRRAAG